VGSVSKKPPGVGVTIYERARTPMLLGKRSALEFPALKTFAVIMLM
jgi:hypothetical protein